MRRRVLRVAGRSWPGAGEVLTAFLMNCLLRNCLPHPTLDGPFLCNRIVRTIDFPGKKNRRDLHCSHCPANRIIIPAGYRGPGDSSARSLIVVSACKANISIQSFFNVM